MKRPALNKKVVRRRFTPREYASVISRQDGKCACCGDPLGDDARDIEFDHELELALGGADTLDNLRALKKKHHLHKTRANAPKIAKTRRIVANGSHRKRNANATEKEIGRILSMGET